MMLQAAEVRRKPTVTDVHLTSERPGRHAAGCTSQMSGNRILEVGAPVVNG